jgi:hypothetical protein
MVDKNTPKKKSAAKKAAPKKAAAKKPAPRKAAYKADAKDGDGDGFVQDGTDQEREVAAPTPSNVIRTNDVKKPSLRARMAKWFKKRG